MGLNLPCPMLCWGSSDPASGLLQTPEQRWSSKALRSSVTDKGLGRAQSRDLGRDVGAVLCARAAWSPALS